MTSEKFSLTVKLLFCVMGIWTIALVIYGYVLFSKGYKVEGNGKNEVQADSTVEISQQNETEQVVLSSATPERVEKKKEYNIEVCYMGFCKKLENDIFLGMMENGVLSEYYVDMWIDTDLKTYLSPLYDEKELVKNSQGEYLSRVSEYVPDYSVIYAQLNNAYRNGKYNIHIDLPKIMSASTDGKFATKYIEVDNTQQKLYVWINGVVVREIFLSGAREDSSVRGVFKIVAKGLEPIAPGGKYMPYWMAFYYDRGKGMWYGLHGLIWMYRSDGSKWIEPVENIGVRISGGCIRMVVEDAKYLYGIFDVGDYVLIHD